MSSKASSTVDVSLFKRGLDHKNRWKIKVHSFIYGQNIFEYDQFWKFETTTKNETNFRAPIHERIFKSHTWISIFILSKIQVKMGYSWV